MSYAIATRGSYAIDERNAERQQLLAQMLNPLTREVLDRVPRDSIRKILDLGCGYGHTTRMLAEHFPAAFGIGFEYDALLVADASAHPANPPSIEFQQGDAARLPFPDASFDLVFTRYMLLHVSDPPTVIHEMLRVVRRGGFVVAYEPDCCIEFCYPPNAAMERMSYLSAPLVLASVDGPSTCPSFPRRRRHELFSRRAPRYGSRPGLLPNVGISDDRGSGGPPAAVGKELMTSGVFDALLASARELETDSHTVVTSSCPMFG